MNIPKLSQKGREDSAVLSTQMPLREYLFPSSSAIFSQYSYR